MIILIGHHQDAVSVAVYNALLKKGVPVCLLDTQVYPPQLAISYHATTPAHGVLRWLDDSHPAISLESIQSVFLCRQNGFAIPQEEEPIFIKAVTSNIESSWVSFCKMLDCLFVNPIHTMLDHHYKPYLLKQLQHQGVRIPRTVVTNDPQQVRQFYADMKGQVIFKPVYGWGFTAPLTEDDLTEERLSALANMPYCFQEKIEGTDVRIYKVGNQLFPIDIRTDSLDFRTDNDAQRVAIELPESVAQQCYTIGRSLDLIYAGIDMRRTPEGEYVFFEANPSPIYVQDEIDTGYPITDTLVQLLMEGSQSAVLK